MIGKPEWFARRKYGGWGLTPKTWQGWAYIALIALPIVLLNLVKASGETMFVLTVAWVIVIILDVLDIMVKLKKDEREAQIEAKAERNSAWAMVAVLTAGIGYQVASSAVKATLEVDPFLVAALLGGLVVKAASNAYLERRM